MTRFSSEGHAGVVAVVGAGTMGQGIAQVAAVAGAEVALFDVAPGAAERAVGSVRERVRAAAARGRTDADADALGLVAAASLAGLAGAGVVVEAVVEELAVKRELFAALEEVVGDDCILASNTSSLSPTALAAGLRVPARLVGMHFFNPVPAMRLVEVVPGLATAPATVEAAAALARAWGKTVVRSTPTPGFVVNRVARAFYAEAWRLAGERAAAPAVIDAVMVGGGGFRMGPFALMDLIGHDVNDSVTRQVWAALGHDPRFEPSLAQRELVAAGWLGRKSGRGVYGYGGDGPTPEAAPAGPRPAPARVVAHGEAGLGVLLERAGTEVTSGVGELPWAPERQALAGLPAAGLPAVGPPAPVELPAGALLWRCDGTPATALAARWGAPVVVVDRCLDDTTATAVALSASDGCPEEAAAEAVGLLQAAGLDVHVVDDIPGLVVTRTVAMLVNLAVDAAGRGVASAGDIDAAMRLGTAYPLGPLAWGDRWGAATVAATLTNLAAVYGDARYRPAPWLARAAATGAPLTGIPWPHRQAAGPAPPAAGVGPAGTPRPAGGEPAGANQEEAAP